MAIRERTEGVKRNYKRPESWGALRKLPSGRYQASYLHEGVRFTGPHTFDAMQDARAWLSSMRADIQRGKWRDPRTTRAERFDEYSTVWLAQRVSSKGDPLRPRTRSEYRRQLDGGLAGFKTDHLDKITAARVRAWHADRMAKSGATSAARETALLRAILNTAVEDRIIERNPIDSKLARSATGIKHRPPTLDELTIMVSEFDDTAPHLKLAVLLAAYGGLRTSEWRSLRRRDLAYDDGRFTISVTRQAQRITGQGWIVGPPKSAEGVRSVALPSALSDEIKLHLSEYVEAFPDSLLFAPSGRSEFLDDSRFNQVWNVAREAAGVRLKADDGAGWVSVVREHDLRHFHLSHYAQSGATLAELKARAGHSTTQAAMVYQHAVTDRAAELADAMPSLPARPKRVAQIG